jgi:hypothetical protein
MIMFEVFSDGLNFDLVVRLVRMSCSSISI